MRGRDLLSINDLNPDEIEFLIRSALAMKRDGTPQVLRDKTIAMLFEKPSLRTRVSFEVGAKQLGGSAIYLSQAEVGLGQREPVEDVARVLSRYVAGIVARTYAQKSLQDLANAADDFNIVEHVEEMRGKEVVVVRDLSPDCAVGGPRESMFE